MNDSDLDHEWFVGSNGNYFRDQAGARYCAAMIGPRDFETARNGVVFGGRHSSFNDARRACDEHARTAQREAS